ncbi:MAG TPA: response regulator [Vicinamibacterales bacterium]|nr:response regulator [Vicinamibacterales bacterium]
MALNLPTDDSFLTTEEVLAYLNVNLRTVYRLIKAGSIPAIRVGRQWRFRKRDLDKWLDSQRISDAKPPAAQARSRVLLVDDEESIRRLLSRMLESAYDVEVAADGETAMRLLRQPDAHYDLLISDLNMPGIDGLMLIREAQRIDPALPAIVITGYSSESSAIAALNLGVAGYLTKPFGTAQVLAAAAKALGARPA